MQYGYRIVEDMASGLSHYLADQGFDSLQEMVGLATVSYTHLDVYKRQPATIGCLANHFSAPWVMRCQLVQRAFAGLTPGGFHA